MSDRTCPVCGKIFFITSRDSWQYKMRQSVRGVRDYKVFCSYGCMRAYKKEHPPRKKGERDDGVKTCVVCGKEFYVVDPEKWVYIRGKKNVRKYLCSWGCLRAYDAKRERKHVPLYEKGFLDGVEA